MQKVAIERTYKDGADTACSLDFGWEDVHMDYPPALEEMTINEDMPSKVQKMLIIIPTRQTQEMGKQHTPELSIM